MRLVRVRVQGHWKAAMASSGTASNDSRLSLSSFIMHGWMDG